MNGSKLITWVVPCFNEEEVVQETVFRILNICNLNKDYEWEIIFVDDGSRDKTRLILMRNIDLDSRIKLITLSRNFGHQFAVQAGLDNASGSALIIIDADLQDPPELAPKMLKYWEDGFDVVYGKRSERASESGFKKLSAAIYYRLLNILTDINIPFDTGDFRLIDRKVIDALKIMPERGRFIRGLITWSGFRQKEILYKRHTRYAGITKYSLRKMLIFAAEGITSFSTRPLKMATIIGLISALMSLFGIAYVTYIRLFTNAWVQGWTALAVIILLYSAVQLISLGILGEYVGRIYLEVKNRPMYLIQDQVGFEENKD